MRWQLVVWASLALTLMAAETVAPGAFLLWLGLAAAAVFVLVALAPAIGVLGQVVAFIVLAFVFILLYRRVSAARRAEPDSLLNRRAEQLIGRVAVLNQPIVDGTGRVQIDDAFWVVSGPELPLGTRVRVVAVDGMTLKVQSV